MQKSCRNTNIPCYVLPIPAELTQDKLWDELQWLQEDLGQSDKSHLSYSRHNVHMILLLGTEMHIASCQRQPHLQAAGQRPAAQTAPSVLVSVNCHVKKRSLMDKACARLGPADHIIRQQEFVFFACL